MSALDEISLREKKAARTRLALLGAMQRRVREVSFDEINVRDLCEDAEISLPTFFNYFPKKWQLIVHYIDLWSIEMQARVSAAGLSGLKAIELIFEATAQVVADNPALMLEIISQQAKLRGAPESPCEVTRAERLMALPELPSSLDVVPAPLPLLFGREVAAAIENGELPADTDTEQAVLFVTSTFFGLAMVAARKDPAGLDQAYTAQLEIGWRGMSGR